MKKTGTLFIGFMLLCALVAMCANLFGITQTSKHNGVTETQYGAFLATQHAIYNNDFDMAAEYGAKLSDTNIAAVKNVKIIADFLSGRLPENASDLAKESGTPARLVYDAYLVG